jgi:hypothetical protein
MVIEGLMLVISVQMKLADAKDSNDANSGPIVLSFLAVFRVFNDLHIGKHLVQYMVLLLGPYGAAAILVYNCASHWTLSIPP